MTAPVIVWMKRASAHGAVHATVDGVGLCSRARIAVGAKTKYQGREVQELVPAELNADGQPFGRVCGFCAHEVQRRTAPRPRVRPVWRQKNRGRAA